MKSDKDLEMKAIQIDTQKQKIIKQHKSSKKFSKSLPLLPIQARNKPSANTPSISPFEPVLKLLLKSQSLKDLELENFGDELDIVKEHFDKEQVELSDEKEEEEISEVSEFENSEEAVLQKLETTDVDVLKAVVMDIDQKYENQILDEKNETNNVKNEENETEKMSTSIDIRDQSKSMSKNSVINNQANGIEKNTFKILTFNIFAGKFNLNPKRIDEQIAQVKQLDCDVMCFQEVQDRETIEKYRKSFEGYDVITCNSNLSGSEYPTTLLLSRGGFCQRLCEFLMPLTSFALCLSLLCFFFFSANYSPGLYIVAVFLISLLLSILIAVFSGSCIRCTQSILRLPQHGFLTGDILGLMIIVRNSINKNGLRVQLVENSSFAEVFTRQAAKGVFKLFGFVERFLIIKGYLSVDVMINDIVVAITNTHLNTGNRNLSRMKQVKELFEKAIPANRPVFLCGDTNAEPNQPEIQQITKCGLMTDTYAECYSQRCSKNKKPTHTSISIDSRTSDSKNMNITPIFSRRMSRGDGFTQHSDNVLTHQGFLIDENMRIDYIQFRPPLDESDQKFEQQSMILDLQGGHPEHDQTLTTSRKQKKHKNKKQIRGFRRNKDRKVSRSKTEKEKISRLSTEKSIDSKNLNRQVRFESSDSESTVVTSSTNISRYTKITLFDSKVVLDHEPYTSDHFGVLSQFKLE